MGDFAAMLQNRTQDLVPAAIEGMKIVISQLVEDSIGAAFYDRAIACLRALREGCVKEEEAREYNEFLVASRAVFENKKRDAFWKRVEKEGLTLISEEEAGDSDYTKEDAHAFFQPGWQQRRRGGDGDEDEDGGGGFYQQKAKDGGGNEQDDVMDML